MIGTHFSIAYFILAILLGLTVGSFLNVVIVRLSENADS